MFDFAGRGVILTTLYRFSFKNITMMKLFKLIGKHENFAQENIPKTLPTSGFFLVGLENSGKILFFAKTLITFERNINISFCFQQMKVLIYYFIRFFWWSCLKMIFLISQIFKKSKKNHQKCWKLPMPTDSDLGM